MSASHSASEPGGRVVVGVILGTVVLSVCLYLAAAGIVVVSAWTSLGGAALAQLAGPVVGTVVLGLGSTLLAAPIGVGIAVWAAWLAPPAARLTARRMLAVVGEIPPACLAVALLALPPDPLTGGWLVVLLGVALVAVPTIAMRTVQAVEFVGQDDVLQAIALGATPAQAVLAIVLPRSAGDVLRAVAAGGARVVGESVLVLLVFGVLGSDRQVLTQVLVEGTVAPGAGGGAVAPLAVVVVTIVGVIFWSIGALVERRAG